MSNEIISAFRNSTAGTITTFLADTQNWEDQIRDSVKTALEGYFITQTQDLEWTFEGEAVAREVCQHLNSPSLEKTSGEMNLNISISVGITDKISLGLNGTLQVDLNPEGACYFDNSLSELVQVPLGSRVVARDSRLSASVSGGISGLVAAQVQGAGSVDTPDVEATVKAP